MTTQQFDWRFYVNFYTDIKAANINTEDKALEHYTAHGNTENRKPYLDVEKYLKHSDCLGEILFSSIGNDCFLGINRIFLQHLVKECKIDTRVKVLEIGCGIACLSLPIIKHLKLGKYYGVDADKPCIDWCKRKITPFCDATFKVLSEDPLRLPFDDGELDLVYSATLLSAIPDRGVNKYLLEINRVLKKGGSFIFTIFMNHQTNATTALAKNIRTKTRLNKINGLTYLMNGRNERSLVHQDDYITTCLEKANFETKDTIFGNWLDTSNNPIYQDIVTVMKIR
jgi:ubiquinone/menaquinone biosynthesis C-methylase UbiE